MNPNYPDIPKVDFIAGPVTNSARYPKKFLQDKLKDWPAGTHLVMETKIKWQKIYAIGYKYFEAVRP